MRSWETKDITDILLSHHRELSAESTRLSVRGACGDFRSAQELDDKCIVIETFLEETFGIEWTGLEFLDEHHNTI
jgi:hypothetical protein